MCDVSIFHFYCYRNIVLCSKVLITVTRAFVYFSAAPLCLCYSMGIPFQFSLDTMQLFCRHKDIVIRSTGRMKIPLDGALRHSMPTGADWCCHLSAMNSNISTGSSDNPACMYLHTEPGRPARNQVVIRAPPLPGRGPPAAGTGGVGRVGPGRVISCRLWPASSYPGRPVSAAAAVCAVPITVRPGCSFLPSPDR